MNVETVDQYVARGGTITKCPPDVREEPAIVACKGAVRIFPAFNRHGFDCAFQVATTDRFNDREAELVVLALIH